VKGTHNSFFWGLRASLKSHEDYVDGSGQFVPNSRFNQKSIKAFTGINSSIGVFNLYYDFNRLKPGLTVEPSIASVKVNGRKNEVWFQDLSNHLLTSKNTLFFNHWKLEANISYQYNLRKLMTDPTDENFTDVDMILQTLNIELKGKYKIAAGHDLILGGFGITQQNRNQEAPTHVLPDYQQNDLSFLVLYNGNITQRLFVQAGLRYEYRYIDVPEQERSGGRSRGEGPGHGEEDNMLGPLKRKYGNISGSLGGTYKINTDLLLRANLASAYRTPNIAELTQDGQHGARYEQGNRDLVSQRNYETDLSMHYHSGVFLADLAAFYNHINNYIFLSPTADTTDEGGAIFRYLQNNANLYGFEGSMEILPLKWLRFRAVYSWLRAQQEDGKNLPLIPQNKIMASVALSKNGERWYRKVFFRVGAEYAFKQNNPSLFETATPSYWLLNAGAGLNFMFGKQAVELLINMNNLLDEMYLDHLSTLKGTGYYNLGRNFSVSVKIPFGKE
jgi:iron complex outermembrane receptor protein